jgi:hypothetical protein
MTKQEKMALFEKILDGHEVQVEREGAWDDITGGSAAKYLIRGHHVRLVKTRELRPDDLPSVVWIRAKNRPSEIKYLVTHVGETGVGTAIGLFIEWPGLRKHWECDFGDGWRPCETRDGTV